MTDNPNRPAHSVLYGLTKREYAAVVAMEGLLAADTLLDADRLAEVAVRYADALLAELERTDTDKQPDAPKY
jgi:hypothetical protein